MNDKMWAHKIKTEAKYPLSVLGLHQSENKESSEAQNKNIETLSPKEEADQLESVQADTTAKSGMVNKQDMSCKSQA